MTPKALNFQARFSLIDVPRAGSPAGLRRRFHVAKIAGSNPARPTSEVEDQGLLCWRRQVLD